MKDQDTKNRKQHRGFFEHKKTVSPSDAEKDNTKHQSVFDASKKGMSDEEWEEDKKNILNRAKKYDARDGISQADEVSICDGNRERP